MTLGLVRQLADRDTIKKTGLRKSHFKDKDKDC
jgi:hypothetical protein